MSTINKPNKPSERIFSSASRLAIISLLAVVNGCGGAYDPNLICQKRTGSNPNHEVNYVHEGEIANELLVTRADGYQSTQELECSADSVGVLLGNEGGEAESLGYYPFDPDLGQGPPDVFFIIRDERGNVRRITGQSVQVAEGETLDVQPFWWGGEGDWQVRR